MRTSADTVSSDLVLYDELENYTPTSDKPDYGSESWRGALENVDVSGLIADGIGAKVYYAIDKAIDIANDGNGSGSVTPHDEWTLDAGIANGKWVSADAYNGDLADVTGVAIDCRKALDGSDFQLLPDQTVSAFINMRAPHAQDAQDLVDGQAFAFNSAYLSESLSDFNTQVKFPNSMIRNDYTKVGLQDYEVSVTKEWSDDNDRDGLRPDQFTFYLTADGKKVEGSEQTVSANRDGTWPQVSWPALDRLDADTGVPIAYSVVEEEVPGYKQVNSLVADGEFAVTNVHDIEKTNISGVKKWENDSTAVRPSSIKLQLLADGQASQTKTVTAGSDNGWAWSFNGLPVYRDHGQKIDYQVQEIDGDQSYILTSEGNPVDGYVFTNTYHPFGALVISKSVEGGTRETEDQVFNFVLTLTNADGSAFTDKISFTVTDAQGAESEIQEIANGGTIQLKAGELARIKELPEDVSYSVDEQGVDGYSTALATQTGTIVPNEDNRAEYSNVYTTKGQVSLEATKVLQGKQQKNNQFRFELADDPDGDGIFDKIVKTGMSNASGEIDFSALTYGNADDGKTFHYQMREVNAGRAGYTYDGTSHDVYVTPHDNGDGTMACDVSYDSPDPQAEGADVPPTFTNAYHAEGSTQLVAYKTITGGVLTDGQFTFALHASDGAPLPQAGTASGEEGGQSSSSSVTEAANGAYGKIVWNAIRFTEKDAGKTYIYWATEDDAGSPAVTYSKAVRAWSVTVVDNGDGTLGISQQPIASDGLTEGSILGQEDNGSWTVKNGDETASFTISPTGTSNVFENQYNPGELDISKQVQGDNGDPAQEFNFRVELSGEQVDDSTVESYQVTDGTTDANGNLNVFGTANSEAHKASAGSTDAETNGAQGNPVIKALSSTGSFISSLFQPRDAWGAEYNPTITYDANQIGVFASGSTTNAVTYHTESDDATVNEVRYSHTPNIDDNGDASGTYANNLKTKADVVSIPGAKSLHVTMYCSTESTSYDWACVWAGNHPDYTADGNYSSSELGATTGKFGGGRQTSKSKATVYEGDIAGDTVTFAFRSDGSAAYYGYYAVVTPGTPSEVTNGTYEEPTDPTGDYSFTGWNTAADGSGDAFPRTNPTPISNATVYAQWKSNWGSWGDCEWKITDDGTLHIRPKDGAAEGNAPNTDFYDVPWRSQNTKIKKIETEGIIHLNSDEKGLFYGCSQLTDISGLKNFDTSQVRNMTWCFDECRKLKDLMPIKDWDMSHVSIADRFFSYCSELEDLTPLANWDTSSMTRTDRLFEGNSALKSLNGIQNWDTSKFTTLENAFAQCPNLVDISALANWNTSSLSSLELAFYEDKNLGSGAEGLGALSSWNTSHVTNMRSTFNSCSSLTDLDALSSWDTSRVTSMEGIFNYCTSFANIDGLTNWNTSRVINLNRAFSYCKSLSNLQALENWDTSHVTDMGNTFAACTSLQNLHGLENWDVSSVATFASTFIQCTALEDISALTDWTISNSHPVTFASMFSQCENLGDISPLSGWDTSTVTSLYETFLRCKNLTNVDALENWNTGKVTTLRSTFADCEKLENVQGLKNWDTSSVTEMYNTFGSCNSLQSLEGLENWDVSNVPV